MSTFSRIGIIGVGEGTTVLVLEPRRRRVRKHVEDVRLAIDPATYLPVQLSYRTAAGGTEQVSFSQHAPPPW